MGEMIPGNAQAAAELRKQLGQMFQLSNPAEPSNEPEGGRRPPRVSMADVQQRLRVPDIAGYRMYWFKDENVPKALAAYYEPVKDYEINVPHNSIGSDASVSGNTDLGTNVSIIAGSNAAGQPVRLNLMKLPLQYYKEDQQKVEARNQSVMEAIFGEEVKMFDANNAITETDAHVYRRKALFNRPARKIERKRGPLSGGLSDRIEKLERMLASKGM
jgi:hypothetical protein